ncbi:MAG: hypothetical protein P9L92_04595 [Candidatus Electryonea clarkiae]|nr:hypothetical protein [Candidatus Electryonea clarkiae]MDP8285544.1 hypothetical protein [Candidatus Electryonea clarkiae]
MAPRIVSSRINPAKAKRFCEYEKYSWRLPWIMIGIIAVLVLVEFMFSPFERALGKYMVWTRSIRQETGTGWELSHTGEEAERKLGQITKEVQERQTAGSALNDWLEIPSVLKRYEVISISPHKFQDLYKKLPIVLQSKIFDPIELLRIGTSGRWHRVFFLNVASVPRIYLVDSKNVVLAQASLPESFFRKVDVTRTPYLGFIEDIEHFNGLSFPASLFFNVVHPAGPVVLSSPDFVSISELSGKLNRVAVSLKSEEGLRALGFEMERNDSSIVYQVWLDEIEAQQLFTEMMDRSLFGEGL